MTIIRKRKQCLIKTIDFKNKKQKRKTNLHRLMNMSKSHLFKKTRKNYNNKINNITKYNKHIKNSIRFYQEVNKKEKK